MVWFIHHLIQNQGETGRRIHDLAHHDQKLANHDSFIQLVFNFRKVFLIEPNALIVDNEYTKAMVVAIHQYCLWHLQTHELWHIGEFSILDHNILVLNEIVVRIEKSNIDRLLSVDLISIFAEALPDFEFGDGALVMLVFVLDLVWAFGPKPFVRPDF